VPLERNSVCVDKLNNGSFINLRAILDQQQITHDHSISLPSL